MLTEKEKRIMMNQEQKLAMPAWKFILVFGVLAWGVVVGILYTAFMVMMEDKTLPGVLQRELWINILLFAVGGILYGWIMRKIIVRNYEKLKAKEALP